MAQAQPRRFRETGKLERALPFVCTPKGTRSIAKTEWGLQQCLRLRVVGIIFIAMWRKRAKHQLRSQPLYEMCLKEGRINAATIADHIEPHKGDQQKFFFGELRSLCEAAPRERQETRGSARLFDSGRRRRLASRSQASRIFEGPGGHEIFLRLPLNATGGAPRFCYILLRSKFANALKLLAKEDAR
jgi:hypothetical protein